MNLNLNYNSKAQNFNIHSKCFQESKNVTSVTSCYLQSELKSKIQPLFNFFLASVNTIMDLSGNKAFLKGFRSHL